MHCCFAHTHHHFTAGHVSSQRGEKINSTAKGGGMKLILTKSTFTKSFKRIMAVARSVNIAAREELQELHYQGKRVEKDTQRLF